MTDMKTFVKNLFAASFAALLLTGCEIGSPDFFVPEVAFTGVTGDVIFDNAGGERTFPIEANCDWTISSPADWVEISVTEGVQNGSVTITVPTSKLDRRTTVTITSNEVNARRAEIIVIQTGVIEISTVERPTALDLTTSEGRTASLASSYTGISISQTDVVTGGFVLTPVGGGDAIELGAAVDMVTQILKCAASGLEPGVEYSCVAWAKLNDDPRVESEAAVFATVSIPPAITSVARATISGAKSDEGTTVALSSSFETVSVSQANVITAGFSISPQVNDSPDVQAVLGDNGTFSANVTGLTAGTEYTVTAWAKLDDGQRVEASAAATFTPEIGVHVTITADFTSNEAWQLPGRQEDMVEEPVVKTVGGYTWTLSGAAINSGSLWIASLGKKGYNGYIQTQRLEGLTVKSISFPNDGPGLSSGARVTLWMSTDGGGTFTAVPGCVGVDMRVGQPLKGVLELPDQPEGCVYRIENVDVGGTNGFSKTKVMTINAID
jgi:hypothetical protein